MELVVLSSKSSFVQRMWFGHQIELKTCRSVVDRVLIAVLIICINLIFIYLWPW